MRDHSRPPLPASMDRAVQDRIGRELRILFPEPLNQPLPDRIAGALRALEAAEAAKTRRPRLPAVEPLPMRRLAATVPAVSAHAR